MLPVEAVTADVGGPREERCDCRRGGEERAQQPRPHLTVFWMLT